MNAPDARYLCALSATSVSILITDALHPDNPIVFANPAFTALFGYSTAEVLGRNCRFLQGACTDRIVSAAIGVAVTAGTSIHCEILNYRKDGTQIWNDLKIDPIHDAAGLLTGFVGIQYEADTVHHATEARIEAEERLASITDHIPGYVYRRVMRPDGTIKLVYCSSSIQRLIGVDSVEAMASFYEHVHPDDHGPLLAAIRGSAADMSTFQEEFRLMSPTGVAHWIRSNAPPRRTANGDIVWDGLAIEITAEKRWEGEIASLALRDDLTGLQTRAAWRQTLDLTLGRTRTDLGPHAIFYVDISDFGGLNDKLGQSSADDILREIARRLSRLAAHKTGAAARLGGDEFAVLVALSLNGPDMATLVRSLGRILAEPMRISGQDLVINTCIGATLCPRHKLRAGSEGDIDELMKQAELALRWAKRAGTTCQTIYSPDQDDRFRDQAVLERSLGRAVTDAQLVLHYQPLVDLASGRVVSAEALVRWNHPTLGLQGPNKFIALAEQSGVIGELGRWVIESAMRQHKQWRAAGLGPPPVAINVSGLQLADPDFVASVHQVMMELDVDANDFEVELTEGLLIEPSPAVLTSLYELKQLGLTITIDDFGSGHATFRYLRDFPVDKLKIDQSFVRKLVANSTDAMIIRAVISLAKSMDIGFVAEGIENELQRGFLIQEGCRIGQGYLFSLPLVAEDFAWLLEHRLTLPIRTPPRREVIADTFRSMHGAKGITL